MCVARRRLSGSRVTLKDQGVLNRATSWKRHAALFWCRLSGTVRARCSGRYLARHMRSTGASAAGILSALTQAKLEVMTLAQAIGVGRSYWQHLA